VPTTTLRGTIDSGEFAALCNLFCATHCQHLDPTPAQAGDILYFHADPMVCDHSRLIARAVMAYLGLRFAGSQPRHEPGSGCRYADPDGNCDFHDVRGADELVNEVHAAMLNGQGSLPDSDNED
jgi:hypothetical protein